MNMNTVHSTLTSQPIQAIQANALIHVDRRNAYHQAGHATAIYLGNQQKQLPAVHFQISIKAYARESRFLGRTRHLPSKYAAKVEGGRLLQNLPLSFADATRHLSATEQHLCHLAIEADITNLLVGPLAEAKHVALRDGEVFNANLVCLEALQFYGGKANLDIINEYMACLLPEKTERKLKLAELFLAAYSFINQRPNWNAITTLAEFILDANKAGSKSVIPCEEVISLLGTINYRKV